MAVYIRLPASSESVVELFAQADTVELRAHATEVVYSDAAYLKAAAGERWPELDWRTERARTARYVVKGERK